MKMKKKWIIIIPLVIAILVFAGLYYVFNREDKNSFTISENKWIKEHSSTIIDFNILNDYPVFGESGVFREFINKFSEDTGFEFNIVPYLKESEVNSTGYRFRLLNNNDNLGENDILLQDDVYVLMGKDSNKYDSIKEIPAVTIGILSSDSDEVIYYLKSNSSIKYKTYDSSDDMFSDYENGSVNNIIIPNTMYLNKTITSDKYNIQYVFTELKKKIVLTLADGNDNQKMNTIVRKYFNNFKKNYYVEMYNSSLLNYYVSAFKVNDKEKAEFLTKTYVYGYVENYPYEVKEKNSLSGIAAEYVKRMVRLGNSDFITYKKYDSIDALKKAIEQKEVDIYFNYFDYENSAYLATKSPFVEKFVVLADVSDNYVVNTFEAMKSEKVSIVEGNAIYNYFKDNSKASLVPFESLNKMLKGSDGNLVVVDKEIYNYYKNSKFKNYEVLFESKITSDYKFMVKNETDNQVFYKIFNYIIGTNSYYNYRNAGMNSLNLSMLEKSSFEELYVVILTIIFLPLVVLLLLFLFLRRRKKIKKVNKEERRKYTDMLTSLKNRNYLNYNMKQWNESKIYPQAIIIIDLNNVKYVNDNYGHENGDKLIVGAASILINTQLENSEIIRSDGNEFLIYLVGYSEQQTSTYAKKLTKEFKNLPYGFGAAVGYSMITDEIKTIDDAINEATLEMRRDKEEYK